MANHITYLYLRWPPLSLDTHLHMKTESEVKYGSLDKGFYKF